MSTERGNTTNGLLDHDGIVARPQTWCECSSFEQIFLPDHVLQEILSSFGDNEPRFQIQQLTFRCSADLFRGGKVAKAGPRISDLGKKKPGRRLQPQISIVKNKRKLSVPDRGEATFRARSDDMPCRPPQGRRQNDSVSQFCYLNDSILPKRERPLRHRDPAPTFASTSSHPPSNPAPDTRCSPLSPLHPPACPPPSSTPLCAATASPCPTDFSLVQSDRWHIVAGQEVEVRKFEKKLRGVWLPAMVLEVKVGAPYASPSNGGKCAFTKGSQLACLVQYVEGTAASRPSNPEWVYLYRPDPLEGPLPPASWHLMIRPLPPPMHPLPPVSPPPPNKTGGRGKEEKWKEDDVYEVERVVGRVVDALQGVLYLVRWRGWAPKWDTWMRDDALGGCQEAVRKYERERTGGSRSEERVGRGRKRARGGGGWWVEWRGWWEVGDRVEWRKGRGWWVGTVVGEQEGGLTLVSGGGGMGRGVACSWAAGEGGREVVSGCAGGSAAPPPWPWHSESAGPSERSAALSGVDRWRVDRGE